MKQCSTCKINKVFTAFGKSTYSKSGYRSQCKQCEAAYRALHKADRTAWEITNKEKLRIKQRAYKQANKEKLSASNKHYRDKTSETRLAYNAEYYKQHLEYCKAYRKEYKQLNKGCINNINARRRAEVIKRTPMWLTEVEKQYIKALYILADLQTKLTGIKWHVDHIVPLQGKIVSGLHIPKNMRVIPAIDNMKKGNRYGSK